MHSYASAVYYWQYYDMGRGGDSVIKHFKHIEAAAAFSVFSKVDTADVGSRNRCVGKLSDDSVCLLCACRDYSFAVVFEEQED